MEHRRHILRLVQKTPRIEKKMRKWCWWYEHREEQNAKRRKGKPRPIKYSRYKNRRSTTMETYLRGKYAKYRRMLKEKKYYYDRIGVKDPEWAKKQIKFLRARYNEKKARRIEARKKDLGRGERRFERRSEQVERND